MWKNSDDTHVSDSMKQKSRAKKTPSNNEPTTTTGRKLRERLISWFTMKLIPPTMSSASPGVKQRGSRTSITSDTVRVCFVVYRMAAPAMPAITHVLVGTGLVTPSAMRDRNSASIMPVTVTTMENRSKTFLLQHQAEKGHHHGGRDDAAVRRGTELEHGAAGAEQAVPFVLYVESLDDQGYGAPGVLVPHRHVDTQHHGHDDRGLHQHWVDLHFCRAETIVCVCMRGKGNRQQPERESTTAERDATPRLSQSHGGTEDGGVRLVCQAQIEAELDRHWEKLHQGLTYYKPASCSAAAKLKANKEAAQPLKDLSLRLSKLLGLDEEKSLQILQCYLQEDYRGTRNSLKSVLQDERQSQALLLKIADFYYEERVCLLRCVLLLLTYFQDERHPYRAEYASCVNKLEKDLVANYKSQFENLFKAEAPTWETHGNLMTERQISRWFRQCLREQSLLLEILFLYYAYFEMSAADLLSFTKVFKEHGFGLRQTNRHLVDKSMDTLVDRIGYFSSLILVEGMDIDFLHKCALEDCTDQHQFYSTPEVTKEMDQLLLTLGDIPHHGPVLLAWVLLRHTLKPDESSPIIRRIGNTALHLGVFKYLSTMLQGLGVSGNNCTASTAKMCIYGLLSFVITSFEEETLGSPQHLIDTACEVLSAQSLAELFWEMRPNMGLGMILDSAVGMFPHKAGPLLQLLTALLSNKSTVKKVYTFLDKMSFYTEVYKHKPSDVISKDDETLWRRQTPKLLYPLGSGQTNLRMPQGVLGQVVMAGEQGYVVRWDYSYSSWTLFTCEVEMLLHVVSTADVIAHCERVKPILDLVHKIISTDWTVSDCLLPLTSRIYMLLQRLTSVINPPVDVIASCVNCLIVLAARNPGKVWSSLHHTGFLPFASTPLTNMAQSISAEGMKAGNYGNLLVQIEQPRGEYAVTIAFLRLITTLVKGQLGSTQNKGLIPCVLLVLKEMLPTYHKWRYNTYGVRERIGCLILELVHAILNLSPEGEDVGSTPTLQSLCIYSLANTEAGQAVVNIMGVGVDTIDMVLAAQPSSGGTEGPEQILIQTVKLAFSVTNNVIRLKPPSDVASPLEQALTQHGGHGNNLIAVLAKYIYHKHDPALPRLAIQLLKRLATVAPMSVYACLGSDAAAIRDAFLTRLQSRTEDMRIKVMILEFLTVAVETQPGLIELFLNLEVKDGSEGSKEFLLGEWSCLQVVLDLIDSKQQGKYWCPPLLQRAALAFLLALWQDRRDSAISVLRTKEKFWENLTTPLFGTLPSPSEMTEYCVLETCAFVMKIIGLEIYYVVSSLEQSLKDALQRFSSGRRYEYWSQYVKSLVCHISETEEEGVRSFAETQMLISAWRMLLILSTTHSDVMQLTEESVKLKLFMDVLDGTKAALMVPMSLPCLRLGSMMATLLLILLKQWRSVLATAPDILTPLALILESVLQADQQLMERTKAKIFSALISVLQIQGLNGREIPQLPQLLLCVCDTVKDEALSLMDSTHHLTPQGDATEDRDSMETDSPRSLQKDQRDGVCVLALHLAKELCRVDEDGEHWVSVMRQVPVLPSVLSALELSLRLKQNLFFTEASLHLLLTLARTPQGAAAVAGAAVIQSICLPLLSVYEVSSNGASQSFSRKAQDSPCWPGVYRLCMSLMESLLKTLRYNFINEALDFVGVHQERILQCLNAVRTVQSLVCLDEADHTVGFLLQLSSFCKEWQFHLPKLLRDVQVNLCYLCQTCTYLLHSKKMLHHYLQAKNGEALPPGPLARPQRAAAVAAAQTSAKEAAVDGEREEAEQKALLTVQCSLLKILSKTLATLQHFTPDCCQILLDQCMDLAEYRTLFVLSFTAPAFDPDVAPSFGTLLGTINVALSMLGEIEKKKEPASVNIASLASSDEIQALKSLLMFTMENCFYVLTSQAARCLKDPSILPRDKQRLKQELSSELNTLLSGLYRHFRRGSPSSPASGMLPSKPTTPGSKGSHEGQEPVIQLVQAFVRLVQR
ncbi:Nucleoporin NUP188 [Merluccius polli]|uniref:Nucleoporin NUP188 n=1 Tax=Merluccius polli TaxID=89951 RepID=A0AA47M1V7_MERPO|nr:Nucleoporin NUP188 [Merluccius polli]